ncbi:MAG: hypothetical protein NWE98_03035 [Candidatus Bathyarchaeota archaeon]|nr:hypothetical protein [Candidatus Bathyarchaeota archaeon]
MPELKQSCALKVGLLIVAVAYFLFNLHSLFTLEWIGEWNRIGGSFSFAVFLQDIANLVGIIARFIGGILAIGVVPYYLFKGSAVTQKAYKIIKGVLVLEAVYWLSLAPVAGEYVYFLISGLARYSAVGVLNNLAWTTIPAIVESIMPPIALLMLAIRLNPDKPNNYAIKWALIVGASYVFTFWLTNNAAWMLAITGRTGKGIEYLTNYPHHMLSFLSTLFGLLALSVYAMYYANKYHKAQTLEELDMRGVGIIITGLGLYFLWNYLSWIFFGLVWSNWYAWFLGHNLDLWMLSLPLVGLPLLFLPKPGVNGSAKSQ